MENEIKDVISDQSRINSLLNVVGNKKFANGVSHTWMSPADISLRPIPVTDVIAEENAAKDVNSLVKFMQGHDGWKQQLLGRNRRFKSTLLQLSPILYPKQVLKCPTTDEVKKLLSTEALTVSLHSYNGYSFSNEFMHVYKGKFNRDTALDDLLVILQRALHCVSPGMNNGVSAKYADFIARIAPWEASLARPVLEDTAKGLFPKWAAHPVGVQGDFNHVEIYLGNNQAGELSFTVRVRFEVDLRRVPVEKESAKEAAAAEAALKMDPNVAVEAIYYREFILNDATIDAFRQVSFLTPPAGQKASKAGGPPQMQVPPPPPKRATGKGADDIRLYLLTSSKVVVADLATDPAVVEGEAKAVEEAATDTNSVSTSQKDDRSEEGRHRGKAAGEEISFCAELYGWGFDSGQSLGLGAYAGRRKSPAGGKEIKDAPSAAEQQDAQLREMVHGPRRIPLDRIIAAERVKMIACSSNHTLLLTCLGSVFACGDNSEGALGTGDLISRSSLSPVDITPPGRGPLEPVRISKIAAGCSSIGAHSMAIDRTGRLYGWGVAYAVGLGVVKAILSPTQVPVAGMRHNPQSGAEPDAPEDDDVDYEFLEDQQADAKLGVATGGAGAAQRSTFTAEERKEVVDVACGGGFTACVTKSGHVFTWGVWAHGRLGHGPVPVMQKIRGPYRGTAKKIARYQMHPRRIRGVEGAVSVSCGEAHALCLLQNGCLLGWGQNSCGQIGCGPSSGGMLADAFRPVLVPHFGAVDQTLGKDCNVGRFAFRNGNARYQARLDRLLSDSPVPGPLGRSIVCGAFHSVCVDHRGLVYTWGARGSPCLGHHDASIVGEWSQRINSTFSISATDSKAMVPFELFDWCVTWSMPRCVQALAGGALQSSGGADLFGQDDSSVAGSTGGISASSDAHVSAKLKVSQVCAGDLSTGFLTVDGKFFLCGTGPAVPSFMPASRTLSDLDPDALEDEEEEEEVDQVELQRLSSVVSSPRCPSDSWLREFCTRQICKIAAAGNKIFLLVDEEAVCRGLTAPLLNGLQVSAGGAFKGDAHSASEHSASDSESVFETRGRADCMILASGKMFLCHKALIAQRSPELRDMIVMESPTDDSSGQLVQILLPELQRDAARALVYYLYRDVLPPWCIGSTSLLTSLARTGKTLRIPRLQLLCDRFLRLIRAADPLGSTNPEATLGDLEMPPPTLARDLSTLVGDPEFADVRFIAEGRAIVAHRFILESRCAYFRGMFRGGLAESRGGEMIDVVVPDTFVGFLRLLIFIYTGTLPDGSDGALLEDLMAADRYVIPDMKLLCENMLVPSESNWLDLLRAAQLLNSLRLELQVMAFLKENFSVLRGLYQNQPQSNMSTATPKEAPTEDTGVDDEDMVQYSNIADFKEEFPSLLEDLLESRKVLFPLPPSQLVMDRSRESATAAADAIAKKETPVFPIWALVLAAVSFFVYQHVSKVVALGPVIPLINAVAAIVLIIYSVRLFAK